MLYIFFSILYASEYRILSLDPSTTELFYELDLGSHLVGRDRASNYPKAAQNLDIVSQHLQIDWEKVRELKPTHMVGIDYNFPKLHEYSKKWQIKWLPLQNQKPEDLIANLQILSKHFSVEKSKKKLTLEKWEALENIVQSKKSFYFFLGLYPPRSVGPNSFISIALEKYCGWENLEKRQNYPVWDHERVYSSSADLYLTSSESLPERLKHKNWIQLNADSWSRLSFRFVDELIQLCQSANLE